MSGILYFVATPIGNLKDISYRAVETLKNVDGILCEDTRHSSILLNNYEISKPLYPFHKFNYLQTIPKYIDMLKQGKNLALISDAGMPSVSDPGQEIVKDLIENDIEYTIIPGASAGLSALVLSGYATNNFCFLGFMPEKKKNQFLAPYINLPATLVVYSAVHDINKDIKVLFENLGDRNICIVREITKKFETITHSTLAKGYDGELRGEFVFIIDGNISSDNELNKLDITEHIKFYVDLGNTKKEAMSLVAKDRGVAKKEIYNYMIKN